MAGRPTQLIPANQPFVGRLGFITLPWFRFLSLLSTAANQFTIPIAADLGGTGHTGPYANGDLLVGDAGSGGLDIARITAGTNIAITNGPGSITISSTGGTVSSVGTGTGLTGGPITSSGTISLVVPVAAANGGTGLSGPYTNGQLLIGNAGSGGLTAAGLSAGSGITITPGAGSISVAAIAGATEQTISANPTGTASATAVMMGLAGTITPAKSGNIAVTINGVAANSGSGDGGSVQISYGTGGAPSNGATLTGTQIGSVQQWISPAGADPMPFSVTAVITGLVVGTAVWLDAAVAAITAGTASISNVTIAAHEV